MRNGLEKTFQKKTLPNNEIRYIAKVTNSLENRGISLTGTAKTIISPKRGLSNLVCLLTKVGFPLTKNVLVPSAKSGVVTLGLTVAASAMDAAIQKRLFGSRTTSIISDEEMNDIMK